MNTLKIIKEYRFSIKITIVAVCSLALYGAFSGYKAIVQNNKINSDNVKIENMNVNFTDNHYVFSGTARDTVTGQIVEFNYASPEVVTANPALLRAILEKLANTNINSE